LLFLALLSAGCRTTTGAAREESGPLAPLAPGEHGLALVVGKLLTLDAAERVFDPGLVLVRGAKLAYVGELVDVPEGYARIDARELWAFPGFVDLHTHIHGAGWNDLNDMVKPLNPELRARPAIDPWEERLTNARAAGVTTLFGIPGSGTSMSGFGTLYKPERDVGYEAMVLRDPGGMKIAQNFNPQRGGGDLGASWSGLAYNLEHLNDRVQGRVRREGEGAEPWVDDWQLENLERVHRGELPVLIHAASAEGVANAIRMWKLRYGTNAIVSHGCWDGWHAARFAAETKTPINVGPRVENLLAMRREDRFVGIASEYVAAGVPLVSLNTDSPVVPQEEYFLQGTMSARRGGEPYTMLRALSANPALAFQVGERVGSLAPGKDADLVLASGDPLDPRSSIELVLIDGRIQYSRRDDGAML
jgi:imidazolonepropionase-like amidohydrolase